MCARRPLRWRVPQARFRRQPVLHLLHDATFLNGQYTVWGKVIEGMDNVDKIKRGEPVQLRQDREGAHGCGQRGEQPSRHSGGRGNTAIRSWRNCGFASSTRPGDRPPGDTGRDAAAPCAPISSISNFRRKASRCGRRTRGIPRGCSGAGDAVCATDDRRTAALARTAIKSSSTTPRPLRPSSRAAAVGRETEPKIEATLIKRLDGSRWQALVKPAKKLEPGDVARFGNEGKVSLLGHLDAQVEGRGRKARSRCHSRFTGRR